MTLRNGFLIALGLAFAACAQQQPAEDTADADTTAADAESLREQVDQFVSAWNVGDNVMLASLVAEDAVLMQPDGPVVESRDLILDVMSQGYDTALLQQSATVDEVIMIGDYAYGRGTWNIDPTPEAGPDVPAGNGKWSAVYQRGPDGGWQIWRWMWNQPSAVTLAVE